MSHDVLQSLYALSSDHGTERTNVCSGLAMLNSLYLTPGLFDEAHVSAANLYGSLFKSHMVHNAHMMKDMNSIKHWLYR